MPPTCWFSCTGHTAALPSAPRATSTEISRSNGISALRHAGRLLHAHRANGACSTEVTRCWPTCRHRQPLPFFRMPGTTLAVPHRVLGALDHCKRPNQQAVIAEKALLAAAIRNAHRLRYPGACGYNYCERFQRCRQDVLEFGDLPHLSERSHRLHVIIGHNHDVVNRLVPPGRWRRDQAPAP